MLDAKSKDVSGLFSSDSWTLTEERRRPLPGSKRTLTRSSSTGSALRSAGLQSCGLGGANRRQHAAKAGSVAYPPAMASCASQPSVPKAEIASSTAHELCKGDVVYLHGLSKAPELNGTTATCESWDAVSGRWTVKLQNEDSRTVAIKSDNLKSAVLVSTPSGRGLVGSRCSSSYSNRSCDQDGASSARSNKGMLSEIERRKFSCSRLAVPRRQRLVERTLEVVRSSFDPTEGLEEAAAAAAAEVLTRTQESQHEKSSSLAQPRPAPEAPPDFIEQTIAFRSKAEQHEHCSELSKPRAQPSRSETQQQTCQRSALEQQRHCAQLSRPRLNPMEPNDSELSSLNAAWRGLLAARDGPPPEGLAEAKEWLASRACYFESSNESDAGDCSEPPTPRKGDVPVANPASAEELRELREVVEELLWVVLLQLRCVPKSAAANSKVLEERLCSLLLSGVGPILRPIARRVLGPGTGLVRRLRTEFPRLCMNLGFRDSDDMEPAAVEWTLQEITDRVEQVRSCRDELLAKDLTKSLMARLGQ